MIADGSHANGHPALAFARVVVSLLVLSMGSWANAGVVVLSSSEMVKFERMQIMPSTSSPPQTSQFDPATGMLITAGYPFPVLGSVISGPQIYNRPSASPPDFLNNSRRPIPAD